MRSSLPCRPISWRRRPMPARPRRSETPLSQPRSRALIAAAEQSRRGAIYGPLIPMIGEQAFAGEFNGGGDVRVNGITANGGGPRQDYSVGLSWKIGPGGLLDWGRIRASGAKLT